MDLKELTADAEKSEAGVWVDYGDDVHLKIASTNTPAYRRALQKASRKQAHKLRRDIEASLSVAVEAMAEAVLIDFTGITDGGHTLMNTLENRKRILRTPIGDFVADQAGELANFQSEQLEDEVAAIKKQSSGKRNGPST